MKSNGQLVFIQWMFSAYIIQRSLHAQLSHLNATLNEQCFTACTMIVHWWSFERQKHYNILVIYRFSCSQAWVVTTHNLVYIKVQTQFVHRFIVEHLTYDIATQPWWLNPWERNFRWFKYIIRALCEGISRSVHVKNNVQQFVVKFVYNMHKDYSSMVLWENIFFIY